MALVTAMATAMAMAMARTATGTVMTMALTLIQLIPVYLRLVQLLIRRMRYGRQRIAMKMERRMGKKL
jgi:hypothetical protein